MIQGEPVHSSQPTALVGPSVTVAPTSSYAHGVGAVFFSQTTCNSLSNLSDMATSGDIWTSYLDNLLEGMYQTLCKFKSLLSAFNPSTFKQNKKTVISIR